MEYNFFDFEDSTSLSNQHTAESSRVYQKVCDIFFSAFLKAANNLDPKYCQDAIDLLMDAWHDAYFSYVRKMPGVLEEFRQMEREIVREMQMEEEQLERERREQERIEWEQSL